MKTPIRILHVVNVLNRGGMESRIMDIYRKLDKNLYQYDFYVESGCCGLFDSEIIHMGGKVFYAKKKKYNIPDFNDFYRFLMLHPEYGIVYSYNQWAGFYLKQANKCNIKIRIAFARTSLQKITLRNIIKDLVKRNVNKYATYKFAVSYESAKWLFGNKVTKEDVWIWPNGIDLEHFIFSKSTRQLIREKLGIEDRYVAVHVGNIKFEKNHKYLLKVFQEITKIRNDAVLLLIGGGNYQSLSHELKSLNIQDKVYYLGIRTDISQLLQGSDVFIFPSLYEGFPGAVLEAEATGLPCIISDSITKEVVISNGVKQLSLKKKPKYWAHIALKQQECVRENEWKIIRNAGYDINDVVNTLEEFYEDILSDY